MRELRWWIEELARDAWEMAVDHGVVAWAAFLVLVVGPFACAGYIGCAICRGLSS